MTSMPGLVQILRGNNFARLQMKQWVDLLERFTASSGRWTCKITISKKSVCNWCLRQTDIPMFATSKAKIEFAGRDNWETIERKKWRMFGGKYLNFTTESQNMSKKILFLVLDVLLNRFFLETLTDVTSNICLK